LDSRLYGRELDSRPPRLILGVDNRIRAGKPSHPGQLSLLPSAGREMSTSQSAMTLCCWRVKAGMAYSTSA